MLPRFLVSRFEEALEDTPVVLLTGARQSGKSTLVRSAMAARGARYLSLDDATLFSAAQSDPQGFLGGGNGSASGPVVIDEVQRAPGLFPAIKLLVDEARGRGEDVSGRWVLTGSANPLLVPRLSESLAGRMEILRLFPLAQAEIESNSAATLVDDCFDDAAFAARFATGQTLTNGRAETIERLVRGGFPEAQTRKTAARRAAWFEAYLTTILERDVRDLSAVENLVALPRLMTLLAARAAGLLNLADVSRGVGVPHSSLQRYMALLEATFLIQLLPAWSPSTGKRLLKAPKVLLCDTGLAAFLLKADANRIAGDGFLLGSLLENFLSMELIKIAGWSRTRPGTFHLRTAKDVEVDLVLEGPGGQIVGVEMKAAASVSGAEFRGLKLLQELSGPSFKRGIVLYGGEKAVAFGDRMWALPHSALWH